MLIFRGVWFSNIPQVGKNMDNVIVPQVEYVVILPKKNFVKVKVTLLLN